MNKRKWIIGLAVITPAIAAAILADYNLKDFNLTGSIQDSVVGIDGFNRTNPIDQLGLTRPASSVRASSVELTARDGLIFYDRDSGRVLELSMTDGQEEIITQNQLPSFMSSIWGRAQRDVISLFSEVSGIQKRYYNFTTKESATLSPEIQDISFSPSGDRIVYFQRGDNSGLYISKPNGTEPKLILKTRLESVTPYWSSDDNIFITTRDSETGLESLFKVTLDGGLVLVVKDSKIEGLSLSPNGKNAVYRGPEHVSLIDLTTLTKKPLNLDFLPNQCGWINDTGLVCPVSRDGHASIDLVNLLTNSSSIIKDIPPSLKAARVFASFSGKVLAIHDAYSGKIFLVNR